MLSSSSWPARLYWCGCGHAQTPPGKTPSSQHQSVVWRTPSILPEPKYPRVHKTVSVDCILSVGIVVLDNKFSYNLFHVQKSILASFAPKKSILLSEICEDFPRDNSCLLTVKIFPFHLLMQKFDHMSFEGGLFFSCCTFCEISVSQMWPQQSGVGNSQDFFFNMQQCSSELISKATSTYMHMMQHSQFHPFTPPTTDIASQLFIMVHYTYIRPKLLLFLSQVWHACRCPEMARNLKDLSRASQLVSHSNVTARQENMLWQMARLGLVPLRLKAALWLHMQGPENSIAFPVVYTNMKMKAHSHRSAFLFQPFAGLQICSLTYHLVTCMTITRVRINYECSGSLHCLFACTVEKLTA